MADADIEQFLLGNGEPDRNPITAFNFVLEVEAVYFLPLKSVRAFTKENEYEYIREGGLNDYVHLRRKQASKPFTFQVERYIGTDRFLDPIANGTELMLPLILHVYRHKAMQGFGSKNLPDAWPARLFIFTGCTVISKEYGELNAEKSALVTETTTFAYRELIVLNNSLMDMIKQLGFDAKALSPELAEWRFSEAYNKRSGDLHYKDPEDERNHAVRAVNDKGYTRENGYNQKIKIVDEEGNETEIGGAKYDFAGEDRNKPVRGRLAGNSADRAEKTEWEIAKGNTKELRGRRSPQDAGYTEENGYNQTMKVVDESGRETETGSSKYDFSGEDRNTPVRGRQAANSSARATQVKWPKDKRAMTAELLSRK